MLNIKDFRIEYRENPLGIDTMHPRFSWKLQSDRQNTVQTGFRIVVQTGNEVVWDSGMRLEDRSICIKYGVDNSGGQTDQSACKALIPQTLYEVDVEITDNHGETAFVSGWFETGLMAVENWKADWITHGFEDDLEACAVFVRKFELKKEVAKARLYASALGLYEFTVNGKPGSDVHFAPGWTSYQLTIQYQTYDITMLLEKENELRFTVGNGWYKGILGFSNQGNHYGNRTALIAQLEITYTDGTKEQIITDESWSSTTGRIATARFIMEKSLIIGSGRVRMDCGMLCRKTAVLNRRQCQKIMSSVKWWRYVRSQSIISRKRY